MRSCYSSAQLLSSEISRALLEATKKNHRHAFAGSNNTCMSRSRLSPRVREEGSDAQGEPGVGLERGDDAAVHGGDLVGFEGALGVAVVEPEGEAHGAIG